MGLDELIVPETGNAESDCRFDAYHSFDANDVPKPFAFEASGLGLAAGGFRSSAKHLAMLLLNLEDSYGALFFDRLSARRLSP